MAGWKHDLRDTDRYQSGDEPIDGSASALRVPSRRGRTAGRANSRCGGTVGSDDDCLQLRKTVSPPSNSHFVEARRPFGGTCALESGSRSFGRRDSRDSARFRQKMSNLLRTSCVEADEHRARTNTEWFPERLGLIRPNSHVRAAAASALRLRPGVRIAPRAPSDPPDFDCPLFSARALALDGRLLSVVLAFFWETVYVPQARTDRTAPVATKLLPEKHLGSSIEASVQIVSRVTRGSLRKISCNCLPHFGWEEKWRGAAAKR